MSFALNSALDTVPHNSNLVRWKRPVSAGCRLCGGLQTLRHVLNSCPVALGKRRFDYRHDEVLCEIFSYLCTNLPCVHPQFKATADLAIVGYSFPVHLYPTVERPA